MGRIEIICGSMFSGKTEELIRRLKRLKYANQSFKENQHREGMKRRKKTKA